MVVSAKTRIFANSMKFVKMMGAALVGKILNLVGSSVAAPNKISQSVWVIFIS